MKSNRFIADRHKALLPKFISGEIRVKDAKGSISRIS